MTALRDAFFSALVALGLFAPMVGLVTHNAADGLDLVGRPVAVVVLVALVFLGTGNDQLVLTGTLVNLMGSRGGDWEILSASAFVSIFVPLCVFFLLQRFLVRGLLAGSVK